MQGIIGKRIASPMNTTVVLTTTVCLLLPICADPLRLSWRTIAVHQIYHRPCRPLEAISLPSDMKCGTYRQWVELFNDPFLFSLKLAPSRDIRIMGVLGVFLGAFFARAILQSYAGQAGCLGTLAGLRLIQMVWWGLIPDASPV